MNTNESSWKPSEGQLECLEYAINNAKKDYSPLAGNRIYLTLKALKKQLEKIKNENIVMEDYKEKYNKLVEAIKALQEANPSNKGIQNWINDKVPELAESEDEKIRKDIRQCIKLCSFVPSNGTTKDEMFAWLEKQGDNNNQNWKPSKEQINALEHFVRSIAESGYASPYDDNTKLLKSLINDLYKLLENQSGQEPADKVGPKFKVGDWVVCEVTNSVYQIKNCIENLSNHKYGYDLTNGGYIGSDEVNHYHLWTIQDAKDGDVLAGKIDGDDYILIFKQIKDGWVETYGHYYDAVDRFCVPSQLFCRDYKGTFHPATKKQCDLLFQKMHEAGYEWDAEKKELSHQEVTKKSDKVGWSEEDERLLGDVITACYKYYGGFIPWPEIKKWLKSIKGKLS